MSLRPVMLVRLCRDIGVATLLFGGCASRWKRHYEIELRVPWWLSPRSANVDHDMAADVAIEHPVTASNTGRTIQIHKEERLVVGGVHGHMQDSCDVAPSLALASEMRVHGTRETSS